jgi:hypothetical protein
MGCRRFEKLKSFRAAQFFEMAMEMATGMAALRR